MDIDLSGATAVLTATGALISLVVMQVVTKESDLKHGYGRMHWCQRASLACLSAALAYDFYNTMTTGSDPRPADFYVHIALVLTLSCWAYRKHNIEKKLDGLRAEIKARAAAVFYDSDGASEASKVNDRVVN